MQKSRVHNLVDLSAIGSTDFVLHTKMLIHLVTFTNIYFWINISKTFFRKCMHNSKYCLDFEINNSLKRIKAGIALTGLFHSNVQI